MLNVIPMLYKHDHATTYVATWVSGNMGIYA